MKGFWLGLALAEALIIRGAQMSYDKAGEYKAEYAKSHLVSDRRKEVFYDSLWHMLFFGVPAAGGLATLYKAKTYS